MILWSIIWNIYIWSLFPFPAQSSPNLWNFLSAESDKGGLYYANKVTCGLYIGWNWLLMDPTLSSEGPNFQSHPLTSEEGRRAGDRVQSPMASDLINHGYIMKPPQNPQRMGFRELLGWWTCGGAGSSWERARKHRPFPIPNPNPTHLFRLNVHLHPLSYPLTN